MGDKTPDAVYGCIEYLLSVYLDLMFFPFPQSGPGEKTRHVTQSKSKVCSTFLLCKTGFFTHIVVFFSL